MSMITIESLNAASQADFVRALDGTYEHSPWIAERAWKRRPFKSLAALKLALDAHEAWAQAALAVYGRAARLTPTLCETLATYGLSGDRVGCGE